MEISYKQDLLEAGCDEAGRGCLAGPVFAAAVILKKDAINELIDDSKKMTDQSRRAQRVFIEENALAYAVAFVEPKIIDEINILNASILAMHLALDQLKVIPKHIIVDGNRFKPYREIPHLCVVKGDAKFMNIAAASILAKTYRDDYMQEIGELFPQYGWAKNKGYPTKSHREAIREFGVTAHHRNSFKLLPDQLELDL